MIRHLFALAVGHAALTVVMTVFVFGSGMARFDTGDPAPLGVQIAGALVGVLAYPVLPVLALLPLAMQPLGFPGEHLVFLANGVIWAAAVLACGDGGSGALFGPGPASGFDGSP